MLFAKYRSESAGGRRHRPTSSEGAGLPHALSMSQASSSVLGPFPNSPPYPSPHVQPAAPPQRYPVSVPRHQVSVSPTMSRAVPGGGPPPPLSYHPDARGPPGSMVLTFEQGKLSFPVPDRVTFSFSCFLFLFPHTPSPSSPLLLRRPELTVATGLGGSEALRINRSPPPRHSICLPS